MSLAALRTAWLLIVLWIVGDLPSIAFAGQPGRIKVLVEMLASKNKDPHTSPGPGRLSFDKDYDRQAQAVVYLAIEQLKAEGSAAFDELIEHLDDKRYSNSYEASSGTFRQTVGDACEHILGSGIYGYLRGVQTITGDDRPSVLNGLTLKQWWKANRGRPLWEIQRDEIDKWIVYMQTVDREKSKPIREGGARGTEVREYRLSAEEFEKRRQENLTLLRAMRTVLTVRKQHFRDEPPGDIYGSENTMSNLPWPTPTQK